jgi:hypothetical protein
MTEEWVESKIIRPFNKAILVFFWIEGLFVIKTIV